MERDREGKRECKKEISYKEEEVQTKRARKRDRGRK